MSEEILINVTPNETRVAIVENGMLQEVHMERGSDDGVLGNIYKGRVSRVLPGMQAAFIDIGLLRTAFLNVSDIVGNGANEGEETVPAVPITDLVREGQLIVVQVIKDPIGTKGARLTSNISVPSRYLVLLPDTETIGLSVRIDDENERNRLQECVSVWNGYVVKAANLATSSVPRQKGLRRMR
jgi:ribonuclease G